MDDPLLASRRRDEAAALNARTAAIHESSARLLRAGGHSAAAERVTEFAASARDRAFEPVAAVRMSAMAQNLRGAMALDELLDEALDGAIAFLAADFGNIQLADRRSGALHIACQRGFGDEFLEHFAVVDDEGAACGRAASGRTQAVIADVDVDPAFAAHRAVATASGFRAVQSTPLIDKHGTLRGVLSTHFHEPHRPAAHQLRLTEIYARLVAEAIARLCAHPSG